VLSEEFNPQNTCVFLRLNSSSALNLNKLSNFQTASERKFSVSSKLGITAVVIAAMVLVSCGLSKDDIEMAVQEAFTHLDNTIEDRQNGWRTVILPFYWF
jgi:hypothetical protein